MKRKYTWNLEITTTTGTATLLYNSSHADCLAYENYLRATLPTLEPVIEFHYYGKEV